MKKNSKGISFGLVAIIVIFVLMVGIIIGVAVSKYSQMKENAEMKRDVSTSDEDYNVLDCVELGDYKNLEVSIAVSQEDIDLEIEDLQDQYTTYKQKEGTVKEGDKIYATYEGYINGEKMDVTCGSDYIDVGNGDWMEGFEDALIGVASGNQIQVTVNVPEGYYGDENVDGQNVDFAVLVEYICGKKIVPDYNDEFVQSISADYNTTDEYNAYIKEKLLKENEEDKAEYAWTDVLEICSAKKYPTDLMSVYEKVVLQGYYDMADIYGCGVDEVFDSFGYGSESEFKANNLEEFTQDSVKEALVADAIAKTEGISYTDEEYQNIVADEYVYNTDSYSTQEEYEEANRQQLQDMALINAVKNWLGENLTFVSEE